MIFNVMRCVNVIYMEYNIDVYIYTYIYMNQFIEYPMTLYTNVK